MRNWLKKLEAMAAAAAFAEEGEWKTASGIYTESSKKRPLQSERKTTRTRVREQSYRV